MCTEVKNNNNNKLQVFTVKYMKNIMKLFSFFSCHSDK